MKIQPQVALWDWSREFVALSESEIQTREIKQRERKKRDDSDRFVQAPKQMNRERDKSLMCFENNEKLFKNTHVIEAL